MLQLLDIKEFMNILFWHRFADSRFGIFFKIFLRRRRKIYSVTQNAGSVLVLSLWIIVLLSLFSLALAWNVQRKISVYEGLAGREEISRISESTVKQVIVDLENKESEVVPKPREWLKGPQLLQTDRAMLEVRVEDEGRKVNVNKAELNILVNLLKNVGGADEEKAGQLAAAIVDYRSGSGTPEGNSNAPSETGVLHSGGLNDRPKHLPLEFLPELLLIHGMTKEIYLSIRDYITIYGDGKVNINAAARGALVSLDLPGELADKIIHLREGTENRKAFVFKDTAKIVDDILAVYPLTDAEAVSLDHAIRFGLLGTNSRYYKITVMATLRRPRVLAETVCIYGAQDGIRYWAEL
jgi:general secretion pathway protein K